MIAAHDHSTERSHAPHMTSILEALDIAAEYVMGITEWRNPVWKQYVTTGDEQLLFEIPTFKRYGWLPKELLEALPVPSELDEHSERFLRACIVSAHREVLGRWLKTVADDAGEFAKGCKLLLSFDCAPSWLGMQVLSEVEPLRTDDGVPTPSGKFLLSLKDADVHQVVTESSADKALIGVLTSLFATNAPKRWKTLLDTFSEGDGWSHLPVSLWTEAFDEAPAAFLKSATRAFEKLDEWDARFAIGEKLAAHDPKRFGSAMETLATKAIKAVVKEYDRSPYGHMHAQSASSWLIGHRGADAIPLVAMYLASFHEEDAWRSQMLTNRKISVLDAAVEKLGRDAIPLLDATFESAQPILQLRAVEHWISFKNAADADRISDAFRQILTSKDGTAAARAVRLASQGGIVGTEKDIWATLGHKSRQARDAAAMELAKLGDSRLSKTAELWKVRRADARIATVAWLKALGTPGSKSALEGRLDDEDSDDVRDAILVALESMDGGARTLSAAELDARIAKTLAKIDGSPVSWLDPKKLPVAKLNDGSKLSANWLLYLLYRQSRVKEMRADIEARAILSQIDRDSSGDLALAVAKAFFASKADADDRWAMAFAALVGDDRLVPVFVKQVKDWADSNRGKLAEYAAQALALLGTDSALVAVDAMAIRYRSKNKNIGKAASEAFAAAAEARGLTVEELGDLVVPWLGFRPGEPRIVSAGKTMLDVRIGNDFKLTFRDVSTNKKVAKLPAGAKPDVQAELKELAAGLKEAAKSQMLRMETLVVRQFRWYRATWEDLYLAHPLLLPFAQRLVWGAYDDRGSLLGTFRTLDDNSLTTAEDEPYALPRHSYVGVVHPLELTPELRKRWIAHFADYDVVPPFAQLERTVISVTDAQRDIRVGDHLAETSLNAMTFKGRAERLGWTRGSVVDGGGITYYLKTFPGVGVDVFIETNGLYIGVDMYTDITLGKSFFVKHGSARTGSYVYDEPSDENDDRLIAYGDVHPIAFSEAMGDLGKIAGVSTSSDESA